MSSHSPARPAHRSGNIGLWAHLRAHLARLAAAHARHARRADLTAADARDTGLCPDDILGETAYDPALPFFFQPGFDCRKG